MRWYALERANNDVIYFCVLALFSTMDFHFFLTQILMFLSVGLMTIDYVDVEYFDVLEICIV